MAEDDQNSDQVEPPLSGDSGDKPAQQPVEVTDGVMVRGELVEGEVDLDEVVIGEVVEAIVGPERAPSGEVFVTDVVEAEIADGEPSQDELVYLDDYADDSLDEVVQPSAPYADDPPYADDSTFESTSEQVVDDGNLHDPFAGDVAARGSELSSQSLSGDEDFSGLMGGAEEGGALPDDLALESFTAASPVFLDEETEDLFDEELEGDGMVGAGGGAGGALPGDLEVSYFDPEDGIADDDDAFDFDDLGEIGISGGEELDSDAEFDLDGLPEIGEGEPEAESPEIAPERAKSRPEAMGNRKGVEYDLWDESLATNWEPSAVDVARLQEMDPFAESLLSGLKTDGSTLDMNLPAGVLAALAAQKFRPEEEEVATQPPVDMPGDVSPPVPTDELESPGPSSARALLARKTAERQSELRECRTGEDVIVVESVLSDDGNRTILRSEYPGLDELEVDGVSDFEPMPSIDELDGDRPNVLSAIDALSREAVQLGVLQRVSATTGSPVLSVQPAQQIVPVEATDVGHSGEASASAAFETRGEILGVPYLGNVPLFSVGTAPDAFPVESLAWTETARTRHVAVKPDLGLVFDSDSETWAERLLSYLADEVSTDTDRGRLSILLHAMGRISEDELGNAELAVSSFVSGISNKSDFTPNVWGLDGVLRSSGRDAEWVSRLLARAKTGRDSEASTIAAGFARWDNTVEARSIFERADESIVARMSKYLLHLGRYEWEDALKTIEEVLPQVNGKVLWTILAAEKARLVTEFEEHPGLRDLFERLVELRGGAPGVAARVESYALEMGHPDLLEKLMLSRFDGVMADLAAGKVSEIEGAGLLAEILSKKAWSLERLGRHSEALEAYGKALRAQPSDRYLLLRALDLAKRLARADIASSLLGRIAELANTPVEAANAWYQLGLLTRRFLADDEKAANHFQRALDVLPTFTPALAAIGRISHRRGDVAEIQARFAEEIAQMERNLEDATSPEARRRTQQGLLLRYFRLAGMLEHCGDADNAIELHKRSLGLDVDFLPSLFALDRIYSQSGRWRELVALLFGWAQKTEMSGEDAKDVLLRTADALRVHLGDHTNAARLYARVLSVDPERPYVLWRAADTFHRLGNGVARIEVEERRGRQTLDPESVDRLVRSAELIELRADGTDDVDQALRNFIEVLERRPGDVRAIDGLVRCAGRSDGAAALAQRAVDAELIGTRSPVTALILGEAMLAGGEPAGAAQFMSRWRSQARAERRLDSDSERALLELLELCYERVGDWSGLADTLEEKAFHVPTGERAIWLTRAAQIFELRLGELGSAADAYGRALACDPQLAAAAEGYQRLVGAAPSRDAHAQPLSDSNDLTDSIGLIELEDDLVDIQLLDADFHQANAEIPQQGQEGPASIELETLNEGLEDLASIRDQVRDVEGAAKNALLRRMIGLAFRQGDTASVKWAAEQILQDEPDSLPALFALRRVCRGAGDVEGVRTTSERLGSELKSPIAQAELKHAAIVDAEASGASPEELKTLLEQAAESNVSNRAVTEQLESLLRSEADWAGLDELYRRILGEVRDTESRNRAALSRARLVLEQLADEAGALAVLEAELERGTGTAEMVLLAAELNERLGQYDGADALYSDAAETDDHEARCRALHAHARALFDRGRQEDARDLLESLLQEDGENLDALNMMVELLAREADWKGVIGCLRRLLTFETHPVRKAQRAIGIGEIFARVYGDHRRAAGWFKRAVELAPSEVGGVRRMLRSIEASEPGEIPVSHVDDAVDRCIAAQRERLMDAPAEPGALRSLCELYRFRGEVDAELIVGQVLCWLDRADADLRGRLEAIAPSVSGRFEVPFDTDLRKTFLIDEGENSPIYPVFAAASTVLAEVLSSQISDGVIRVSRRSYTPWQNEFASLMSDVGVPDVEVWNAGGGIQLSGGLIPQPAVLVPVEMLERQLNSQDAFHLGSLLEGLRDRRLLLALHEPSLLAGCIDVMASAVRGEKVEFDQDQISPNLAERLSQRARRMPRAKRLVLEVPDNQAHVDEFAMAALAEAVHRSRLRVGLLCCSDISAALDACTFGNSAAGKQARDAGGMVAALGASPDARSVLGFALSREFLKLRKQLGLGAR